MQQRQESAAAYHPGKVDCLLVAEAPPSDESRYFYFEDVSTADSLYLELAKALFLSLDVDRLRSKKAHFLERSRSLGLWLIDLAEEPIPSSVDKDTYLRDCVKSLLDRCHSIKPRRVILVGTSVYDVAYDPLVGAELPVVDERIAFPGSGRQEEFRAAFWRAIRKANQNADPVVLDGNCISYWLDALDDIVAPNEDDVLAKQKLFLVRMFYYWPWVLSYTQGIRAEVEQINDPERLARHEQWMNVHLRELPAVDPGTLASARDFVSDHGVNKSDAPWMAESMALSVPLVVTWDQDLLGEATDLPGIEVISPEAAWSSLSVPAGMQPRITPTADNPLSQQEWWHV